MHAKLGVISRDRTAATDDRVFAFIEHCHAGGADFIAHLKDWHLRDALEIVNDAAQCYTPERAIVIIKKELDALIELAADAHRAALEWEGVE